MHVQDTSVHISHVRCASVGLLRRTEIFFLRHGMQHEKLTHIRNVPHKVCPTLECYYKSHFE